MSNEKILMAHGAGATFEKLTNSGRALLLKNLNV